MTAQEMLDYTFGLMDGPRRDACEQEMAEDPALADRVARLGSGVALMLDDGESYDPPPGLLERTAALVERRKQRPQFSDFVPSRVPFRWADVAVAATVFFAAMLTLSVPLLQSRAQMDQAACAFNLGKLGVGLARYTSAHGSYPIVPASYPAGTYGVMLHDSQNLPDPSVLSCPCLAKEKTPRHAAMPDYEGFRKLFATSPKACTAMLDGHFAYNVGYRLASGEVAPVPDSPLSLIPVAADGPSCDGAGTIHEGNSPNHGGHGQNVLFTDGHVAWRRTRWLSDVDRDIYLNNNHRPAPGLHPNDSALVPSVLPVSVH